MVSPPPSSSGRSGGGGGKGGAKKRGGDRIPPSRPRGLQEADLRQLEGEGKPGGLFGKGLPGGPVLWKRAKKSRIVMLDTHVSGGRGKLAVLADGTEEDDNDTLGPAKASGHGLAKNKEGHRHWDKMPTCLFCGMGPDRSRQLLSCWFCPKSFHAGCLEGHGTKQYPTGAAASTLVCPQHRCTGCAKSTAAAGGLLFRCQTCAYAYCQGCLPETEVAAFGRNPQLEALGYFGKQSYWIRCGTCVNVKVNKLHRTTTDASSPTPHKEAGSENEGQGGKGGEGDAESGRDNGDDVSGAGRRGQGAAEPRDSDQSESESDSDPEREPKPEPMPFAVALTLLQDHPAAKAAFLQPSESSSTGASSPSGKKRQRKAGSVSVELIAGKVQAGRYRSSAAFESDARQMITQGKGPRSLSSEQKEMLAFFEAEVSPKLRIA